MTYTSQHRATIADGWFTALIDAIMARRHAGSGTAVFVDPVVLRDLITKHAALDQQEAQGCASCRFAGVRRKRLSDPDSEAPSYLGHSCNHPMLMCNVPDAIDGQPFGCRGWRPKEKTT